jgi:hypothetical protein
MLNNHRSKTLPWSYWTWLQLPDQTWMTLNPESRKYSSQIMKSDGCGRTKSVLPHKCGGDATDSEDKICWRGRDARVRATTCGLWKSQTTPVISRLSHPEIERGPALLRGLQETKGCHEERLFPTTRDWHHSRHFGWNQMILRCGREMHGMWILILTTRRLPSWLGSHAHALIA